MSYLPIDLVLGLLTTTALLFYFVTQFKWYWQIVIITVWLIGVYWIVKATYFTDAITESALKVII